MKHTSIRGLIAPSRWFPPAVKQRIGHLAHAPHRLSPMQSASDNQTPAACTIHQMRQSFQDPAYGFRRFVDTHITNRDDEIGDIIVTVAINLHRELGPGLLESVYEVLLAHRLESSNLHVERPVSVPIQFDGVCFEEGFRADLIVEIKVIFELKKKEKITPAHKKQLLTYLKLTGFKVCYLLNFGEELMRTGITRTINGTLSS